MRIAEQARQRHEKNVAVEPEGRAIDIFHVQAHALAHQFRGVNWAARAIDLGPAGDPGLDAVAVRIVTDNILHRLRFAGHSDGMRPGTNNGHLAFQNIPQLRQLIQ